MEQRDNEVEQTGLERSYHGTKWPDTVKPIKWICQIKMSNKFSPEHG